MGQKWRIALATALAMATFVTGGCTAGDGSSGAPSSSATTRADGSTQVATPQATLPTDMEEATIDSMAVGGTAYTVSWAMWIDAQRRAWLNPKYGVSYRHGTLKMRVERRRDGYHVWPPSDARYQPVETPGYVGQTDLRWIPVVEIHHL